MTTTTPTPIEFGNAIENIVPEITCTNSTIVEIEDTPENDTRIATIATLFQVSQDMVGQAIIEKIEYQLTQDPPDKELTDLLIREEQDGFQRAGD